MDKIEEIIGKTDQCNVFYADGAKQGGYPDDIRNWAKSNSFRVIASGSLTHDDVITFKFINLLLWLFRNRKLLAYNVNILCGGFIVYNVIYGLAFKTLRIPYHFMPLSQYTQYSINNRLFGSNPIIKGNKLQDKQRFSEKILKWCASIYKPVYLNTFGKFLYNGSTGIIVASEYEAIELRLILGNGGIFYSYTFDLYQLNDRCSEYVYDKTKINIVYWGRVDFINKGLDRVVNVIKYGETVFLERKMVFHFAGPSYNNGFHLLTDYIKKNNVQHLCNTYNDIDLEQFDFGGLVNANAAIFLTRWEGFPRVVRECIHNKIPILVSRESHFGDFRSDPSIYAVSDADDTKQSYELLLKMLCNKSELNVEI